MVNPGGFSRDHPRPILASHGHAVKHSQLFDFPGQGFAAGQKPGVTQKSLAWLGCSNRDEKESGPIGPNRLRQEVT